MLEQLVVKDVDLFPCPRVTEETVLGVELAKAVSSCKCNDFKAMLSLSIASFFDGLNIYAESKYRLLAVW